MIPDVLDPDAGTPESSLDTAVPEDGADVKNKGDPAPPEPEPVFTVETGEWFFRRVEMVSDPCEWKPFLDDLPDGLADVLPTSFDVDSRDGGFDIEAVRFGGNFGTTAPVTCVLDDREFACAPQPVIPVDLLLGGIGWTYEVVFTGEALDETTLSGTSVVTFGSVDERMNEDLADRGFSVADCTQVLEMVIGRGQ